MKTRDSILLILAERPSTSWDIADRLDATYKQVKMSLGRLKKAGMIRKSGSVKEFGSKRPLNLWELCHATSD